MAAEITEDLIARQTPETQGVIRALLTIIDQQAQEVAELKAKLAEVEAKLGKTPRNSSKPPSSEHPHAKPTPKPKKPKRKRGGQPGHPKYERALVPTDECRDVIPCKPGACRCCGKKLRGRDSDPLRFQVRDVEIIPFVNEYQQHRLECKHCGTSTCGTLPDDVNGQTGPVLTTILSWLTSRIRSSRRRAAEFSETVCSTPCSVGHVSDLEARTTKALKPTYDELATALPEQEDLGIDETPFKQGREKTWLWTFVAAAFTVFVLRPTRQAIVLVSLLGDDYGGVINCDRAKMYFRYRKLQWCWAHLKRDFQALIDSGDNTQKRLGHDLMRQTKKLFKEWAKCRDGTIKHATMKRNLAEVRREVEGLLLRGFGSNSRGMCKELYAHKEHLWTFLDHEGVEPTNNASERSLRHGVIWRKLSFGTQSERGNRYVETMLTVIETCRQQDRNAFEFIRSALEPRSKTAPPLSLLPA